ncbi:P60-like protein [Pholiota conissans]|uniref:Ribosome biogenesis protein NOP53 n=1 Tax=Pholiota conissans TaxID=109636 RepID=A0A9P5ZBS5_9AGAR|nr:P60-like protein [Pholiota conissans]
MAPLKNDPKAKASSNTKKGLKLKSTVGAPSQHSQSSRKGKRAWRKNVNIEDVEEVLEGLRAEERIVGSTLGKLQDGELFQIDTKGDDHIRNHLPPRYSAAQLTSTKILAQRSAVPAVLSRITSASNKRKSGVSRDDKERLMRIAKRPRKGPFNSILDPSEYAAGSGIVELSEAVKKSGTYDAWAEEPAEEVLKDGLETVQKKKPKAPSTTTTRDLIAVPAITQPHQGTSYNPPVDAHTELIEQAAAIEQKRLEAAEKLAATKEKMHAAKGSSGVFDISVAAGMTVQKITEDGEEEEDEEDEAVEQTATSKKDATRKTSAQKNKAARLLKEKRALAEKVERKRLLASINDAKFIRRSTAKLMQSQEEARQQRLAAVAEKLKTHGLAGQKLGKHKVPESNVEVQIGEDLTESLRALKVEGNLFRDRFRSLQQRALIEPRVPVIPTKRKRRIIEYEKHAWKNFDRE